MVSSWTISAVFLTLVTLAGAQPPPVPLPESVTKVFTTTYISGAEETACTTTQTEWPSYKGSPHPTPAPYLWLCDSVSERGHEMSPDSLSLDGQELEYITWPNLYFKDLYFCCEVCLASRGCAMYDMKDGICGTYMIKEGNGVEEWMCPKGVFEVEQAEPVEHRVKYPEYAGGRLPGPCFKAGKLSSYECDNGYWG